MLNGGNALYIWGYRAVSSRSRQKVSRAQMMVEGMITQGHGSITACSRKVRTWAKYVRRKVQTWANYITRKVQT